MSVNKKLGYKEVLGAVTAFGVASLLYRYGYELWRWLRGALAAVLLTVCKGVFYAKLEHHSSMPEYYDRNTTDILGLCFRAEVAENCGPYCPIIFGCVNESIHGPPTHGQDPSGEVGFEKPFWVWK